MRIIFHTSVHFERWDWCWPEQIGIGGSETSHTEMSWRLARRGHDVLSYAPIPDDCAGEWRGVPWKRFEDADYSEPGLWIVYRDAVILDKFGPRHADQPRWLISQDIDHPNLTDARIEKIDRLINLNRVHLQFLLERHPSARAKLFTSSNGIKTDEIEEFCATTAIGRNPKRIIYGSSPDRGLVPLLHIFKRLREIISDAELAVAYGFNNIEKIIAGGHMTPHWMQTFKRVKAETDELLKQPGVTWLGRLGQKALWGEYLKSGLWCYPTDFTETSCITCMEAQALGAIPVTRPLWALLDNVQHGILLDGSPASDPLVRARYVGELVRLMMNPDLQERIRAEMMPWARQQFDWERMVDQWEQEAQLALSPPVGPSLTPPPTDQFRKVAQYEFQHRHARGKILNIGCHIDASGFQERGAINLDVRADDPVSHSALPVDVLADAREPLPFGPAFDTVIVGDLLEHMDLLDGVKVLTAARHVLAPGGCVVLTVPNDQRGLRHNGEEYAPSVSAHHNGGRSRETVLAQIAVANLNVVRQEVIHYPQFDGHGWVLEADHAAA